MEDGKARDSGSYMSVAEGPEQSCVPSPGDPDVSVGLVICMSNQLPELHFDSYYSKGLEVAAPEARSNTGAREAKIL